MAEIERSFGDTDAGRILRALGAILIGAFAGAIIGTPTITGFAAPPQIGFFTVIDAAIGAFLFLTGMRLLQSNAPRGQVWLGGLCVGGVTGAFIGAMFPAVGPVILGSVVALLFASFVIWSPYREDPRAGIVWTLASGLLVGLFFFALATLFPIVQHHHATGYAVALLAVCGPCGIIGFIGGLIFARQTGSRKRLTLIATGLIVVAALVPFVLYHVPLRDIQFPEDRQVGEIRFSNWFTYGPHPAQGTVRVPLRGIIYLQLDQGAVQDLSFFEELPGLYELDMSRVPLQDADLARIAALKHLRFLVLTDTPIGDASLEHLAGLRHLEALLLGGTQVTGTGLPMIAGLPSLRLLNLERTPINDAAAKHIAGMQALRELNLFMTGIGDAALGYLSAAPQIVDLDVSYTQVTQEGLNAFREARPDCDVLHERL